MFPNLSRKALSSALSSARSRSLLPCRSLQLPSGAGATSQPRTSPAVRQARSLCVRVMATAGGGKRVVLWFRNDLRLHDNYIVHDAAQRVKRGEYSEVRGAASTAS